jgi:hypothetical protein
MEQKASAKTNAEAANLFNIDEVFEILARHRWIGAHPTAQQMDWIERATALLGPQASAHEKLIELLTLIFHYEAVEILQRVETHSVLSHEGAREIIRQLALLLLEGSHLDSDRFKQIINALKTRVVYRSRELFLPIRLALAGRAGSGELDRVILLLDSAARANFSVAVKGARQRIVEFCAALD